MIKEALKSAAFRPLEQPIFEDTIAELMEILARAYEEPVDEIDHSNRVVGIRILSENMPTISGSPFFRRDLLWFLPRWLRREKTIGRWQPLLMLFGDMSDSVESLGMLHEIYRKAENINAKIEIVATFFQILGHLQSRNPSLSLSKYLSELDSFFRVIQEEKDPAPKNQQALEDGMKRIRRYILAHWQDLSKGKIQFSQALLD